MEPNAPAYCFGAHTSKGQWTSHSGDIQMLKITIALAHGHAPRPTMQLSFDLIFFWEGAKPNFPFVRRGINPEATSNYLLPCLPRHYRVKTLLATFSLVPTHCC
ncbi:hypothetical protein F5879DRAFT_111818 [Lentinula edodes]|nr:hypothetical protein F5879DRAFT_111818 [Lentinula edodes]